MRSCLILLALSGVTLAQQKEFGWVRANNQVTQLDPADFRAGRVYHPGENGATFMWMCRLGSR